MLRCRCVPPRYGIIGVAADLVILIDFSLLPRHPREKIGILRSVAGGHSDLLLQNLVDRNGNIRTERVRPFKGIMDEENCRLIIQCRCVRTNRGHHHQIGAVLHDLGCIPVIRMIVIEPVCEDQIRPKPPDQSHHFFPRLQISFQAPVRMRQHDRINSRCLC